MESVVAELGLVSAADGEDVRGRGEVYPEACVPSTGIVRTSVLATWADVVTGVIAGNAMSPRIPLTLDLEVHVERPAASGDRIDVEAVALKVGRTIVVSEVRFGDGTTGEPVAFAIASFIASPDPAHVFPEGFPSLAALDGRLPAPLAERVACSVVAPGTAEIPHRPANLNASGAIQGGMVAVVAEEAAASLHETPTMLEAMNVRYLRPFTVGPARAVAAGDGRTKVVQVTDVGTGKLGALVTARSRAVELQADERRERPSTP